MLKSLHFSASGRLAIQIDLNDFDPPPKQPKHVPQLSPKYGEPAASSTINSYHVSKKFNQLSSASGAATQAVTTNRRSPKPTDNVITSKPNKAYGELSTSARSRATPTARLPQPTPTYIDHWLYDQQDGRNDAKYTQKIVAAAGGELKSAISNGFCTTDTICNADTLRLCGSDMINVRSKFMYPAGAGSDDSKMKPYPTEQPAPPHNVIAYANVRPPNAFSDTGTTSTDIYHQQSALDKCRALRIATNSFLTAKHTTANNKTADFTIAV